PVVRAVDQKDITAAEKRGVQFLRSIQQKDGSWPFRPREQKEQGGDVGATALALLAMLECEVPDNDEAIKKGVEYVREKAPGLTTTYSIALSIMLFDRLGDAADIPQIESLMVRLIAGQGGDGGWGYSCPAISEEEVKRLTNLRSQKNELRGKLEFPKFGTKKK